MATTEDKLLKDYATLRELMDDIVAELKVGDAQQLETIVSNNLFTLETLQTATREDLSFFPAAGTKIVLRKQALTQTLLAGNQDLPIGVLVLETKKRVCLVRKTYQDDPTHTFSVGCGLRIGQYYILTGKHVLLPQTEVDKGREWAPSKMVVEVGYQDAWYECAVISASPKDIDLVLLEIPTIQRGGLVASPVIPLPKAEPAVRDAICACGYPKPRIPDSVFRAGIPDLPPLPSFFSGRISFVAAGRLELDIRGESGFSGTGVLFEKDATFCGMIVTQATSASGVLYAVPEDIIVDWVKYALQDKGLPALF